MPTSSVLGHFIELLTNNSTSFKTLRNGDSENVRRPSRVTVVWKEKQFSIYRHFSDMYCEVNAKLHVEHNIKTHGDGNIN